MCNRQTCLWKPLQTRWRPLRQICPGKWYLLPGYRNVFIRRQCQYTRAGLWSHYIAFFHHATDLQPRKETACSMFHHETGSKSERRAARSGTSCKSSALHCSRWQTSRHASECGSYVLHDGQPDDWSALSNLDGRFGDAVCRSYRRIEYYDGNRQGAYNGNRHTPCHRCPS